MRQEEARQAKIQKKRQQQHDRERRKAELQVQKELQQQGQHKEKLRLRRIKIQKWNPEPTLPLGLVDIKRVDLFYKWRKFAPAPFQDDMCPRPPKDIIDEIKHERKIKASKRETSKAETKKSPTCVA